MTLPANYTNWSNPGNYAQNFSHTTNSTEIFTQGSYYFTSLVIDSNAVLTIQGPATIVADNLEFNSNVDINIDSTNG